MSKDANQRLHRVLQNLKTETAIDREYSDPKTLQERMADEHTPAVSLAIIDDFKISAVGAYGTSEAGSTHTVSANSLFLAGSISKPIFAAAVMFLVQTKQLDLDEDINHYLSSWQIPARPGWQPRITLRHLLSHTAGLTVHGFPGYQTTEAVPTIQEILNGERPSNTRKVEVNSLPGLQFRYSGGGTTVAQLAMTEYLQGAFPELMQRLVFEPLGMHNSTFENPLPPGLAPKSVTAHPWKSIPLRGRHHVYPEMAAAGLWTTPTDLATFGLALQKSLCDESSNFLNKSTIESMLSPQLPQDKDASDYCGLGFFCEGKDESAVFGHGGWDEGFVAELKLYKTLGKGAVVMLNSNQGYPLIEEIMRAIAEEYDWPIENNERQAVELDDLNAYVGHYKSEQSQSFAIQVSSGRLYLQYGSQNPIQFEASSVTNFFCSVLNTEIDFERNTDGFVSALTLKQGEQKIKALKCDS